MNFPFLFKSIETTTTTSSAAPWPWPSCANTPKTLSFRTPNEKDLHDKNEEAISKTEHLQNDDVNIILGLKSERLFFEPSKTSFILEEAKSYDLPYKESTALIDMDSIDPILDFRVSMEEMVKAYGLKDLDCLEELLKWYLKVNVKSNHGYIVGAFVDLLLNLDLASAYSNDSLNSDAIDEDYSSATNVSFTSPLSFSSSIESFTSASVKNEDEIVIKKNADSSNV